MPYSPVEPDELRIGPHISISRDIDHDADQIELPVGVMREARFFVRAEFHQGRIDLHEFLGSVVHHQMNGLGLTISEAAHLAGEDPDGFLRFIDGSPDIATDRLIKAVTALGARVDVGRLDDPFVEIVPNREEDVHE